MAEHNTLLPPVARQPARLQQVLMLIPFELLLLKKRKCSQARAMFV